MRFITQRLVAFLAVVTMALSMGLVMSAPAQAASRNGKCGSGEFCYNFNSNLKGSWSDFTSSVGDYGTTQPSCYDFKGSGAGKGKCIKNDAGGYWNRSSKPVTVYFNSGYKGKSYTLKPGSKGKLPSGVYNNNASHKFGGSSSSGSKWASPVPSSAVITARKYYSNGSYHGAVDYSGFSGKFESACNGTIDLIRIDSRYPNSNGPSGSTNYLWVDCGNGIRMGYAHWYAKDRPSSLKKGAKVKAGQDLINVGNQGNSSGKHLHFEVRRNGSKIDGHDFLQSKNVKGLPRE